MADAPNSYDEFPYQSVSMYETHPDRSAVIAAIFGLDAPRVETARVLELGCADGGNLIPLAQIVPNGSFVGVDLSPLQIEQAESFARAAGVDNVRFEARSLVAIDRDLGPFDFVICHGVYSWVPDDVKAAIFRVCVENLAANGVAYVSYNTYPGWHVPGMIREMMLYHVHEIADPAAKVRAARGFLDLLSQNVVDRTGHYAKVLREEADQLKIQADWYVLHEHLEELNHPIYFSEFARRAADHGLKVLGDSRFWTMAAAVRPPIAAVRPPIAAVLDRVAQDPIGREQYLDFLCNRRFRRSLLCHAGAETSSEPNRDRLRLLRASALVWPKVEPVDLSKNARVEFRDGDGAVRLSTMEPLLKATMIVLAEAYPASVPFDALWSRVRDRLGREGIEAGASSDPLADKLLMAHAANAADLHAYEPSEMATAIGLSPRGFPVARLLAVGSLTVPNLRHRQVTISDFDRLVLRQLDGRRTHPEIVEGLVAAVVAGEFAIRQDGREVRDPSALEPILARSLEPSLRRMVRGSLLMT